MKEGWEYKKLGEVCEKAKNIKWEEHPNQQYKYIDLSAVDRLKHRVLSTVSINSTNAPSRAKQIVKDGDVLFATTRPTLKRLVIVDKSLHEQICSTGFCVLRPIKEKIESSWLYYILSDQSFYNYIEPLQKGASYPAVTDMQVKSYLIPIPPLSEQHRIVSYLDSAFAKIDAVAKNAEDALKEAKALFQSALTKMMEPKEGWEYKKLGEVCQKTINIKWDEHPNHQYKYIDLSAVDRMTHKVMSTTSICSIDAPSRAKQIVNEGDVLFATTRPTLKRLVIIDKSLDGQICSTGFCVLRPTPAAIMSSWLYYALSNQSFYNYIEPLQKGASYPAVTDNQVKSYKIPVPPLSDQRHIVSYLDVFKSKVDQLQSNLTRTLSECAALKQSILRQTFE